MKTLSVILCIFLSLGATSAQAQFVQAPDLTVRDLLEDHNRKPRAETYYLIGMAEARKSNYIEAQKAINTGLQINPRSTRLINLQGAILSRQGRLVEARTKFLTVLQIDPDDRYAATSLRTIEDSLQPDRNSRPVVTGSIQRQSDELQTPTAPVRERSVQVKQKVLESSYFQEIKGKQRCYYAMENIKRAQEQYIKTSPTKGSDFSLTVLAEEGLIVSIPICPSNGRYRWESEDIACSEHGSRSEVGAEVSTVFTDFNRGLKSKLGRNYLDALKAFEQVVIRYPNWGEAHYQLGDTLFRLGETDQAVAALRKCLNREPNNLDAQLLLANLYFKKGQKNASLKLLDDISQKHQGTVYSLSARSVASSIRSGRNYYQIFPPN